ncbi:UNVERIFIED_CONTAM: hypothetical protein Sangu_2227600 [Sesamum angustifolium]|uniref:Uncharacterized protein n=1 Tax=Sesamum angustifolium TaxID=2727405 RepID=A0AAW2L3I9_9LAMI
MRLTITTLRHSSTLETSPPHPRRLHLNLLALALALGVFALNLLSLALDVLTLTFRYYLIHMFLTRMRLFT